MHKFVRHIVFYHFHIKFNLNLIKVNVYNNMHALPIERQLRICEIIETAFCFPDEYIPLS